MNKKLLKSIVCIASGMGFIASILFAATSCGCSSEDVLPSNVLPESVYEIDANNVLLCFKDAFLNDPDSEIYKDKFKDCDTMEIPAKVTNINQEAFFKNSATTIPPFIKNLTFAEDSNCFTVGAVTFYSCSALTSIILPSALKIIDSGAFQNCRSLYSIDFSNCTNLSTISDGTFNYCSKLTSIDLSNATNLTTIGSDVFGNCSKLTSVTFPSSLQSIGTNAFQKCSKLNDIKWKSWAGNIDNLDQTSFSGVCPTGGTVTVTNPSGHDSDQLLNYLLDNGGLPSTWAKDVTNPLPEDAYNINENNVFLGFSEEFLANPTAYERYNTIEIPARVASVGSFVFDNVPSFITKLTFAEESSCSSISSGSFANWPSLTSVDLSNLVSEPNLPGMVFIDCPKLASLTFSKYLISINAQTFKNCPSINHIAWDLPNEYENLLKIGTQTFSNFSASGTVRSLNTSIASSQQLLEFLQTKGLPADWTAAN